MSSINLAKIGEKRETSTPSQYFAELSKKGVETVIANTGELKGLLAGMLLGDSCLTMSMKTTNPNSKANAYMRIQHSNKQRDYLLYKANILEQLTAVKVTEIGGKYPGVACSTRCIPFYTRMYKIIYPNGKKTVNKTWVNWLTPQGLALWYMDDGSLNKSYSVNKSGRRRIYRREIYLHTCSFSLEENQMLVNMIYEKFGIRFRVFRNGKYYRLQIGAIEANKFIEIVKPYIIPTMQYKINMEYDEGGNRMQGTRTA